MAGNNLDVIARAYSEAGFTILQHSDGRLSVARKASAVSAGYQSELFVCKRVGEAMQKDTADEDSRREPALAGAEN